MSYKPCPPYPLCNVAPIIASRVYGSGRLFQPYPLAMQAPGYAYIDGDQNPATPLLPCAPCGPGVNGAVPRAPDGFTTDVVGAGILSPVRWRGAGVFADNYALPGDIAREPNEGWWASETIDADTGKRSWITGMSGLGGLGATFEQRQFVVGPGGAQAYLPGAGGRYTAYGPRWRPGTRIVGAVPQGAHWVIASVLGVGGGRRAFRRSDLIAGGAPRLASSPLHGLGAITMPSWFNDTFISIGGIRIPNWIGWGLIAFVAYRVAKKRGMIKNRRRGRRRNASGPVMEVEARELELFIENDGTLYRQMYEPTIKNLATKVARGQYDHEKAIKGFMYLVDEGAKRYLREYGGSDLRWHELFNTATRRYVAHNLALSFETENALGNYKSLLPKKYQKNRSRRRSRRA